MKVLCQVLRMDKLALRELFLNFQTRFRQFYAHRALPAGFQHCLLNFGYLHLVISTLEQDCLLPKKETALKRSRRKALLMRPSKHLINNVAT